MDGIWIDKAVIGLKLNDSAKMLLALICVRAGRNNGVCDDSNPKLAEWLGIKADNLTRTLAYLETPDLIRVQLKQSNRRSIFPRPDLLSGYWPVKSAGEFPLVKLTTLYSQIDNRTLVKSTRQASQIDKGRVVKLTGESSQIDKALYNKDINPFKTFDKTSLETQPVRLITACSSVEVFSTEVHPETIRLNVEPSQTTPVAHTPSTPVVAPIQPVLPVHKPIPIPTGKIYGNGQLQADCIHYYQLYPDQFPLSIYLPFIRWWTQKYQKGDIDRIGMEKWLAMDKWDLETRLDSWHQRELKNDQSNGSTNSTTAHFLNRQRAAEPQSVDDYGNF